MLEPETLKRAGWSDELITAAQSIMAQLPDLHDFDAVLGAELEVGGNFESQTITIDAVSATESTEFRVGR
jgi:hypothetical protein